MAGSCHFETKSVTIYVAGENEEFQKVEYLCGTNSIIDGCYYVPSLIKVPGFSGWEEVGGYLLVFKFFWCVIV